MSFNAVLFDLDGTLLDTIEDLADSTNAVLADMGLPVRPVSAYRYFVGDGVQNLIRRALPESRRSADTIARAVEAMGAHYERRWACKTRPYDGVPEMLDTLARRGLTLTVLSNKPDEFARLCVAHLLPLWRFAVVLGARTGVPVKPHPAAAIEVAERIGIPPGEFLYLGDTNTDMQTALAAGMYPVGAVWGFRTAEELREAGARELIERPMDLCALV